MNFNGQNDFLIIGHRGAAGLLPENTLPSFEKALELGCSAIELDVYLVEETLIVIHDDTLDRTTDRRGAVSDLTMTELNNIDAGNNARIPTLESVFQLVAGYATNQQPILVNIELKGPQTAAPVANFLANPQDSIDILVSSFDHAELSQFRLLNYTTPVAPLFHKWHADWRTTAEKLSADAVNLSSRIATAAHLGEVHRAGFRTYVYTVNTRRRAKRLAQLGCAGIFTDRPDLMLDRGRTGF